MVERHAEREKLSAAFVVNLLVTLYLLRPGSFVSLAKLMAAARDKEKNPNGAGNASSTDKTMEGRLMPSVTR